MGCCQKHSRKSNQSETSPFSFNNCNILNLEHRSNFNILMTIKHKLSMMRRH